MTIIKNKKFEKELKNKNILITGGAGSIGSALAKEILKFPVKTLRDLDIDENCIMVLKYCGPKGYPGMAEVGNMGLPSKVLKKGITESLIRYIESIISLWVWPKS